MRKFVINVNGNSYEVEVEEVEKNTLDTNTTREMAKPDPVVERKEKKVPGPKPTKKEEVLAEGQEVVEAPMPGNIWKVSVEEGDQVKSGDVLLILEAMKMENEILAPRDGEISSINTTEGSAVNTGDKLVVLD